MEFLLSGIELSLSEYQVVNETCEILTEAIERYGKIISSAIHSPSRRIKNHLRRASVTVERPNWGDNPLFDGFLDEVDVKLTQPCEAKPTEHMREKCMCSILKFTIFWKK